MRVRPSPAMAVSLIALFVALGGTGYAFVKLPKNSVKAKQIAAKAVGTAEAHDLTLDDFKAGESEELRGPKGDTGAQGEQGAQGVQGPAGTPAAIARTVVPVTGQRTQNGNSYVTTTVGTFVKREASSRVEMTYATDLSEQDGCRIQLRIDGANADGETGADSITVTTPGDIRLGSGFPNIIPSVALASFAGLAPGTHSVQIAVASGSGATICTDNASNIERAVIVEEVPPAP